MRDIFGGISKTALIANIITQEEFYFETLNTLRFAAKAKTIVTAPRTNFVADGTEEDLKAQISYLMNKIEALKKYERENPNETTYFQEVDKIVERIGRAWDHAITKIEEKAIMAESALQELDEEMNEVYKELKKAASKRGAENILQTGLKTITQAAEDYFRDRQFIGVEEMSNRLITIHTKCKELLESIETKPTESKENTLTEPSEVQKVGIHGFLRLRDLDSQANRELSSAPLPQTSDPATLNRLSELEQQHDKDTEIIRLQYSCLEVLQGQVRELMELNEQIRLGGKDEEKGRLASKFQSKLQEIQEEMEEIDEAKQKIEILQKSPAPNPRPLSYTSSFTSEMIKPSVQVSPKAANPMTERMGEDRLGELILFEDTQSASVNNNIGLKDRKSPANAFRQTIESMEYGFKYKDRVPSANSNKISQSSDGKNPSKGTNNANRPTSGTAKKPLPPQIPKPPSHKSTEKSKPTLPQPSFLFKPDPRLKENIGNIFGSKPSSMSSIGQGKNTKSDTQLMKNNISGNGQSGDTFGIGRYKVPKPSVPTRLSGGLSSRGQDGANKISVSGNIGKMATKDSFSGPLGKTSYSIFALETSHKPTSTKPTAQKPPTSLLPPKQPTVVKPPEDTKIKKCLREIEKLQEENDVLRKEMVHDGKFEVYKVKAENQRLKEALNLLTGTDVMNFMHKRSVNQSRIDQSRLDSSLNMTTEPILK